MTDNEIIKLAEDFCDYWFGRPEEHQIALTEETIRFILNHHDIIKRDND